MRVERVEQPVIFDSDCLSAFAAFSDGIKIIKETLGDMDKQSCDRRDLREHRQRLPKCDIRREKQYALGVYKIRTGGPAMELFRKLTDPSGSR